ncbi:hypothetical protein [Streptomyces sp. NPDC048057]|uniref:hypothetical protein n=1 Tax=Streptomyces sp. NPDC048057 TaxID=3155628 RepID=UPI0033E8DA13
MGAPYADGTVVYDSATKKVGVVMARMGSRYALRPRGGGREWDAETEDLSDATSAVLGPAVAELNANSRNTL